MQYFYLNEDKHFGQLSRCFVYSTSKTKLKILRSGQHSLCVSTHTTFRETRARKINRIRSVSIRHTGLSCNQLLGAWTLGPECIFIAVKMNMHHKSESKSHYWMSHLLPKPVFPWIAPISVSSPRGTAVPRAWLQVSRGATPPAAAGRAFTLTGCEAWSNGRHSRASRHSGQHSMRKVVSGEGTWSRPVVQAQCRPAGVGRRDLAASWMSSLIPIVASDSA